MEKKVRTKKVEKVEAKAQSLDLNPKVWDVPFNADLVAQVLFVQRNNERTATANAKSRADVSGGGRKPWKQKGTGRARAGSSRSPLWVGGGVTFVPNERNWNRKINKKMIKKAIAVMLSQRLREESVVFVAVDEKQSLKDLRSSFVKEAGVKYDALVISNSENVKNELSNVGNIDYCDSKTFSVVNLVKARKLVVDNEVVKMIDERLINEK